MKAQLRQVDNQGVIYDLLRFCCPGCAEWSHNDGLHLLPVNTTAHSPTHGGPGGTGVCHSFLRAGVFEFLADSTHSLAGQSIPMPDLPEWVSQ